MSRMEADIFGCPIGIPANYEGYLIGAAMLAFKALGRIESFDEIANNIKIEEWIAPDSENHLLYQEKYKLFTQLYQSVKPVFGAAYK